MDKLQELLEAIFFAGLEREKGRLLRFTACYSETDWALREDSGSQIDIVPFLNPHPLSAEALRSSEKNWHTLSSM
jgi:hypothetical protein